MEYKALLLEKEGREFEPQLLTALKQSGVLDSCYAYKTRVKSDEKLLEKVKIRKEEGKEHYNITEITDVIGLRIITLFRVDMVSLLEKIINIIKYEDKLSPNPFRKDSLEELIFYTNRTNDNIELPLKDVVVKLNVESKYEIVQRGGEYSSIHIVARLNKKISKLCEGEKHYYLPVEVQIRTVFEDAWGEVDHKYGYSIRKGKKTEYKVRNPQSILRHCDTLKKFSDACGEYADAIHLEILNDNIEETGDVKIQSVESDQQILDLFSEVGVQKDDIETYVVARRLREEGLGARVSSSEKAAEILLKAGAIFKDLSEKYCVNNEVINRIFYYYTRMNYAFCLLSTNIKTEVLNSLKLYAEIELIYPEFLLVKMRLAQAYGRHGLIDLALNKCDEAYMAFVELNKKGYTPRVELPEADYNHIKVYLPKVYGYYLWLKAETMRTDDTFSAIRKTNVLRKAYFLTEEATSGGEDLVNLYNNLLYYAMEIAKICKLNGKVRARREILDSIGINLEKLISLINIETSENIYTLDTIAKAYNYLERHDDRDKVLRRLLPLAEKRLEKHKGDNEVIGAMIKEANEMLGNNFNGQ